MPFQFKEMPRLFPEQRIWGCIAHGYTFIITEEFGKYSVSAKHEPSKPRIDLGGFEAYDSFDAAQQACVDFIYRSTT